VTVLTPTRISAATVDLSPRFFHTATVAASPTDNSETTIASLTIPSNLAVVSGVFVWAFAAYTVGTSGDGVNLKIRQTDTSGSTIKATGLVTATAADLGALALNGLDTAPSLPNQVYVLTMTVHSGAAASTVSAVTLAALVI
jgi:hypothetical protein